jgi:GNAT superfamily N-acetyltransferase
MDVMSAASAIGSDDARALFRFRKAIERDAPLLTELEQSGGLAYRADPEIAWVADGENLSPERYREIIADGWTWVAEDEHAEPVAFIAVTREGGELHIWEFNVRLDCQRRGIGRRLLQRLIAEATAAGIAAVTLTTFRDIAWNGPFYQSMGFEPLAPEKLDTRLAALLAGEIEKGLPAARRCAMRRVLPSNSAKIPLNSM